MNISRAHFFLLYAMLCLVWGSTWLVIHIGQDAGLPPFTGAAIRFGVSALLLWCWALFRSVPLPKTKEERRAVIITGVLSNGISFSVVYWASQYVPSGLSAVIFGTMPLWTAVFSHIAFPDIRLTFWKITGIFIGISGIAAIFFPELGSSGKLNLPALAIFLVAPMVSGLSSVITKKYTHNVKPVMLNAVTTTTGFVMLGAIALYAENVFALEYSFTHAWTIGYLTIFGTIFTFGIYFRLLKATSAITMSYITLITPVIAVLLGWSILHEKLGIHDLIGGMLVLIGVWASLRSN